jgi:hypothetical protein
MHLSSTLSKLGDMLLRKIRHLISGAPNVSDFISRPDPAKDYANWLAMVIGALSKTSGLYQAGTRFDTAGGCGGWKRLGDNLGVAPKTRASIKSLRRAFHELMF